MNQGGFGCGSIGMYPQYILVMSHIGCGGIGQYRAQGGVISIAKFLSFCSYNTWVCSKMGSTAQKKTMFLLGNMILAKLFYFETTPTVGFKLEIKMCHGQNMMYGLGTSVP